MFTFNELVFSFKGSYVCSNFGEIDEKCERKSAQTPIHTLSDAK